MTPKTTPKTQLIFQESLPGPALFGPGAVLVYDRALESFGESIGLGSWIKRFKYRYPVQAGEGLKRLRSFPKHFEALQNLAQDLSPSELCFVSLGGGSVGDFTGFAASTFKRGVKLIHIPSTWLAAMDSVHGGKTALNSGEVKNSIGTFYSASKVFLIKPLLFTQPPARQEEALGELAKIALIDGGSWTKKVDALDSSKDHNAQLWKFLPSAIQSKLKVVRRDPFERSGERRVLNLGHTLGHVIESYHQIPHGKAVAQGLIFSVQWSAKRKLLSPAQAQKKITWLKDNFQITLQAQPVPSKEFMSLLKQDKKRESSQSINFVFFKHTGKCVVEKVKWNEFLTEAKRQGWVLK